MRSLRNRKAAGIDGIDGELLKYSGEKMALILTRIYNQMFEEKTVIEEISTVILIPLNKPK